MRIRIYPEDLIDRRGGFKRVAKKMKKKWPGTGNFSLCKSLDTLAKSFGYRDYHDVVASSKEDSSYLPVDSQSEVRNSISKAVLIALYESSETAVNMGDIFDMVASLPLNTMLALKHLTLPKQPASPRKDFPELMLSQHETAPFDQSQSSAFRQQSRALNRASGISKGSMAEVGKAAIASGSLRDHALLAFLRSGMRPYDFLGAKVSQIQTEHHSRCLSRTFYTKAFQIEDPFHSRKIHILLSADTSSIIQRYIESENLGKQDFLFPSPHDSNRYMTLNDLSVACRTWADFANLKDTPLTPQTIRRQALLAFIGNCSPSISKISNIFNHFSSRHSFLYLPKRKPRTEG